MDELRAMLIAALADAGDRVAATQEIYTRPYSTHDSEVAFHEERGRQRGLGKAVEILDDYMKSEPVKKSDSPPRRLEDVGYRLGTAYYRTADRVGAWFCSRGKHRRGLLMDTKPHTYRCSRCGALYEL